ncbi:hypothetical protein P280DRAFT_426699 [Massarina eburnea CBS 473.64]|uniref:Cohesin loading factor-domain-containing protein n=1 Tax=Massarina eburnea CBS 473.64 TaxID=1395130 RepID=A0A6A6S2K0_9PLEO|nr:hypothetical protein P280DRAFT_426699 [Massarina eburnea CBS 473.64]
MDPRYNWPPQGPPAHHPNAQYAPPPQQNGYPQNGYGMPHAYPQQMPPMSQGYPQAQPLSGGPRVVIPQRTSQQYPPPMDMRAQQAPRQMQPQVVIPARPQIQMIPNHNQRIRQVQMPAPTPRTVQRPGGGIGVERGAGSGHMRPSPSQSSQTPVSKPVQRPHSQSFQENVPRPQHRPQGTPVQNHNQHRTPLKPQGTPAHAHTPSQYRSPSLSQPSSQVRSHPQVVIKRPSSQLQTPTRQQHAPAKPLPADLMVLILSAADEYIAAARSLGSLAAMTLKTADLDQYYRLMAAALGCMEMVLQKYNQAPRDEALLRLRYASLLVEETGNDQEIEETLSKGIALCNRSRLHDLKYAMLHLQVRYQAKSSCRAALKSLDQPISETETFQHIVWVYAFRFLKVTLALQVPGRPEIASALQQLHAIANHAERRGDRAIFVTCCALEAMIHLRGTAPDRLEHAQRAIASARSLQLQLSTKQLGQISVLIDCIDVACNLQHGQPNAEKLAALQKKADQDTGPIDGVFSVLIEKSFGGNLTFNTGGVFRKADDGRDELVFAWLPQKDLKTLAYYLSGLFSLPHDRGNSYLQEGHRLTQASLQRHSSMSVSIPTALAQRNWVKILDWHVKFSIGLVACYHEDKSTAKQVVVMLQERVTQLPFNGLEPYARSLHYLSAVLEQSNGSIDLALAAYSRAEFSLPDAGSGTDFKTDIALLATMHRLLIIRNPSHPEHYLTQILFAQLQPLCTNHPNLYIECAFRIIQAITNPEESINRQKTLIHTTTNRAQKLANMQFMSICLNYMADRFFANQVGDQPIKSVRAARNVSKQGRSVLWRAVASGICINTFQRNGLFEDAMLCVRALEELRVRLPVALRGEDGDVDGDVDAEGEEEDVDMVG